MSIIYRDKEIVDIVDGFINCRSMGDLMFVQDALPIPRFIGYDLASWDRTLLDLFEPSNL